MGGKTFLLSFEDDELYIMLEDLNWSYLKEIFATVEAWSENLIRTHRATWIEILGLRLHCWNEVTLQRIVDSLGVVEAFGENVNRRLDCEKVTVLILTDHAKRIDETIEIKIGNFTHEVSVVELGFKDISVDGVSWANKPVQQPKPKMESSSESSSEQDSGSLTMEDEHSFELEKEAFNDLFIGKDYSAIKGQDIGNIDRHIGESDLLGVICMDALNKDVCAVVGDESGVLPLETATLRKDRGCLEALDRMIVVNPLYKLLKVVQISRLLKMHTLWAFIGSWQIRPQIKV
ncbi:hypothetical protein V6N13_108224 [Hibiscus sabdariffa]